MSALVIDPPIYIVPVKFLPGAIGKGLFVTGLIEVTIAIKVVRYLLVPYVPANGHNKSHYH